MRRADADHSSDSRRRHFNGRAFDADCEAASQDTPATQAPLFGQRIIMSQIRNTLPHEPTRKNAFERQRRPYARSIRNWCFEPRSQPPDHPHSVAIAPESHDSLGPHQQTHPRIQTNWRSEPIPKSKPHTTLVRGEPTNPGFLNKGLELRLG
jgi:hypothetical protein